MQRLVSKLPPFKALIAFEAVVRLGTVTAAAKELTSTQPAVSQQLKSLEGNLNTQLFIRRGRNLQATAAALEFYTQVAPLLGKMAGYSEQLRVDQQEGRRVNIVANCGLAHFWLLPMLERIKQDLPQLLINVTLSDGVDSEFENALLLGFGKLQQPLKRTLFVERVCIICSVEYAQQHGLNRNSSVQQIVNHPLIHMDVSDSRWLNWQHWFTSNHLPYPEQKNVVLLGNYHSVISNLQQSQGLALGWLCLTQEMLQDKQLVQVSRSIVTREEYGYFIKSSNAPSSGEALVYQYLVDAAAQKASYC